MGKTYGNYSVRRLSIWIFYLNLWDIVTDLTYFCSRDFYHPGMQKVCLLSLLFNSVGLLFFLLIGFCVNCLVRQSYEVAPTSLKEDFVEMVKFWHSFYFKRVLELPFDSNKAMHRTSLLVHVVLEAIPQMIIQGVNNTHLALWSQPLSLMSFSSSFGMILVAAITFYQTDKYGHYY